MQLYIHKQKHSRTMWRMEAYLECSSTELKFLRDNKVLDQIAAVTPAIPGNGLKSLWQHASFGSDGIYSPGTKTRLVKYSLFGAIQNSIYEKIFEKASTRKIRVIQLTDGLFLIGKLRMIESAMAQLINFVENLEARMKMQKAMQKKLR